MEYYYLQSKEDVNKLCIIDMDKRTIREFDKKTQKHTTAKVHVRELRYMIACDQYSLITRDAMAKFCAHLLPPLQTSLFVQAQIEFNNDYH